jgi:hypothetical protein
VTESPEDLLEPEEDAEEDAERADEDDEPRWSGEESLGLLPPDE